jgi:hypothetical protein
MCQNNGHGLICAWNKSLDWPATTQGGITTATSLKPTKKKLTEVQKNHRKKKKKKSSCSGKEVAEQRPARENGFVFTCFDF